MPRPWPAPPIPRCGGVGGSIRHDGLLAERETNSARLRDLNATLEQRVAERAQELEQARETLAFALDSAGMGTWDLDLATDLSRRTPQHDHIFGYAGLLPEWGRSDFLRHVVPDDQTGAASAFDGAAQSGTMTWNAASDAPMAPYGGSRCKAVCIMMTGTAQCAWPAW